MSFTKTISTIAALASVFGAGIAGFKLTENTQQQNNPLVEKIEQLENQLKQTQQQSIQTVPPEPVNLPPVETVPPPVINLPPVTPPPPVPTEP